MFRCYIQRTVHGIETIYSLNFQNRSGPGKVVWITGAGTGIGEAAAKALAAANMYVVLSGRREEPLQALADSIGERAWVEPLDVADKEAVQRVGASVLERYGRCDVLVNSAGLNAWDRNWHNVSTEGWEPANL